MNPRFWIAAYHKGDFEAASADPNAPPQVLRWLAQNPAKLLANLAANPGAPADVLQSLWDYVYPEQYNKKPLWRTPFIGDILGNPNTSLKLLHDVYAVVFDAPPSQRLKRSLAAREIETKLIRRLELETEIPWIVLWRALVDAISMAAAVEGHYDLGSRFHRLKKVDPRADVAQREEALAAFEQADQVELVVSNQLKPFLQWDSPLRSDTVPANPDLGLPEVPAPWTAEQAQKLAEADAELLMDSDVIAPYLRWYEDDDSQEVIARVKARVTGTDQEYLDDTYIDHILHLELLKAVEGTSLKDGDYAYTDSRSYFVPPINLYLIYRALESVPVRSHWVEALLADLAQQEGKR